MECFFFKKKMNCKYCNSNSPFFREEEEEGKYFCNLKCQSAFYKIGIFQGYKDIMIQQLVRLSFKDLETVYNTYKDKQYIIRNDDIFLDKFLASFPGPLKDVESKPLEPSYNTRNDARKFLNFMSDKWSSIKVEKVKFILLYEGAEELAERYLEDAVKYKVFPAGKYNNFAIVWASKNGETEIVRALLKNPNVNPSPPVMFTPITLAIQNRHLEIINLLLNDPRVMPDIDDYYKAVQHSRNSDMMLAIITKRGIGPVKEHLENFLNLNMRAEYSDVIRKIIIDEKLYNEKEFIEKLMISAKKGGYIETVEMLEILEKRFGESNPKKIKMSEKKIFI